MCLEVFYWTIKKKKKEIIWTKLSLHSAQSDISKALVIQSILNANITNLGNGTLRHQSSISLKPFSSVRELTFPLVLQLHAWFTQATADSELFPAC